MEMPAMDSEFDQPVLSMHGIQKHFAGVHALRGVDFKIYAAEVVALIGENGAGKSTLMKMLGGIYQPDAGEICFNGRTVSIPNVRHSIELGIGFIHQELNVMDNLDIAGNMYLGREPVYGGALRLIDKKKMINMARPYLERLGFTLSPATPMKELSIAQQQIVEIAKALSLNACILIMDEPTSSLTQSETQMLFKTMQVLRSTGVSIVYISHRLGEIEVCADRVVGLRDGANSGQLSREEITHDNMVRLMVGRQIKNNYCIPQRKTEDKALKVDRIKTSAWPKHELSFEASRGEILGITGLVGSGRTELACTLFGVDPSENGCIYLDGRKIHIQSVSDAVNHGIYLVPEDRRNTGLVVDMSVMENLTLPRMDFHCRAGMIDRESEVSFAQNQCRESGIKTAAVHTLAKNLSGGNQQKVVLSKWLSLNPQVMILDEPTRGIDIGSKTEIYKTLRKLSDMGVIVLMISSDMEEVLGVCDRIMVMYEGRITGILERKDCTEERLMNLAVGKISECRN
ncbi:MAG: sugar ABC transporter ATP-binding protein [Anaerohalosphaeraceae bacterium]